jgi:putative aldouronate transport system substrate-binding protein
MKKRLVALLLAGVMAMGLLSGCGGGDAKTSTSGSGAGETVVSDEKIDVLNQTETMQMSIVTMQGYTQPDSQTEKWLEERYNLDIEVVALPGWNDGTQKVQLLMADEGQRPDIVWWWGMEADFAEWVDAGLLVDVKPYMDKYTVMRDYYNSMDPSILFYAASEDGSIYRIPGDVAEPACEALWIRQDWLDNLGLEVPKTLDELEDCLYAFTFDDPDGNGVDDTYGLGGQGNDYRSLWPWIQGSGNGYGTNKYIRMEDGTYAYGPATEDCKLWLERVAKLYADGVICPGLITGVSRDDELAKGYFGVAHSWVAWNNPNYGAVQSFYTNFPDAKLVPIDMVTGDNGNAEDHPDSLSAWCYFAITNVCPDPERAYAIWDDMSQPENYIRRRFGVEGEHYIDNGDGTYEFLITSDSAENSEQNMGLKLFQDLFSRKDYCNLDNIQSTTELFEKVKNNSRDAYSIVVEKQNPAAYVKGNEYGTDINDIMTEYVWGVIGGSKSLDDWDSYIAELNEAGLQEVLDEMAVIHAEQMTRYEAFMSAQ